RLLRHFHNNCEASRVLCKVAFSWRKRHLIVAASAYSNCENALACSSVAFLIFLTAAAGAGVVASYLFARPALLLGSVSAACAAGRSQFPFLLAVELLFEQVNG